MRKNIINITLFASLLTLAGCSNEADIVIPDSAKTPIALSVGVDAPQTRAVITDGIGKTLNAFTLPTDIWMVMQSEYVALSDASLNYKGATDTKYCVTSGTTGAKINEDKENEVSITGTNIRYWDDAHARSTALSVYALAVPKVTGTNLWGKTAKNFDGTTENLTVSWEVPAAQSATSMVNKDLCFSNNIADNTSASKSDARMKFDNTSDTKAFDTGKLIFYHALTKITVNLVEGAGFVNTSTDDFNLSSSGVTLKGSSIKGIFNVATGEFNSKEAATATTMACGAKTETGYILEALVLPGRNLSEALADALSFSIDGNNFTVSNADLLKALKENSAVDNTWTTMEAGNNYEFTFTINKTGIKLTATIAEWQNVTGQNYAPKINITEVYGQKNTETNNFGKGFTFYRSLNQTSEYGGEGDKSVVSYDAGATPKYAMTPQLYWPDHQTHYFFRGIWPLVGDLVTPETADTKNTQNTLSGNVSGSAISVKNVPYEQGKYPSDLMLGFPRKEDGSSDETCKVHTTTQGICATEGEIHMNFQYVMSKVKVVLKTSEGVDAKNKVVFDENTTVEIVGGYTGGNILLSNGSANLTTKADYTMHRNGETDTEYFDAIIPQLLVTGDAKLKFRITVTDTDGHQDKYETVFGIADIDMGGGSTISAWEPGKFYTYTLTITKTGIKVTATIKDWVTATGSTNIWM